MTRPTLGRVNCEPDPTNLLEPQIIGGNLIHRRKRGAEGLGEKHTYLRLRTRLLLWFLLFTAAHTFATSLVDRHSAQQA
jgi:hypothetical protein